MKHFPHLRALHPNKMLRAAKIGQVAYASIAGLDTIEGWSQPVDATLYLRGKRWSVAMDQGFRRGFTAAEKTELWDRWQRGESLKAIGRAFGKPSSSIYFQVSPSGECVQRLDVARGWR